MKITLLLLLLTFPLFGLEESTIMVSLVGDQSNMVYDKEVKVLVQQNYIFQSTAVGKSIRLLWDNGTKIAKPIEFKKGDGMLSFMVVDCNGQKINLRFSGTEDGCYFTEEEFKVSKQINSNDFKAFVDELGFLNGKMTK